MAHSIVVRCPNCSQKYRLSPDKIGAKARCKCGQRFTIASETPLDEETVLGWVIEGADPSSRSVLGGTSIMDTPAANGTDGAKDRAGGTGPGAPGSTSVRQDPISTDRSRCTPSSGYAGKRRTSGPVAPVQPRMKLDHIDELGAHFEFPADMLTDERLRDSFPKQCVCCGRGRRLNVHLIVWNKKLPCDDPLRIREISQQPIGRFQTLAGYAKTSWLSELPKLNNLPEPFSLPFPFFVCSDCTIEDEIVSSLLTIENVDYCQICIANLLIGFTFYRNNGGGGTPEYERLLRESEKHKKDRWRSLPVAVRRKISQWYEIEKQEEFKGFFPDADFSRSEMGKAGVVLTDKHLSFHKYSASREFSLSKGGKIYLQPDQKVTTLRIVQRGRKDATVNLEPALVEKMLGELRRSGRQWTVSGQARARQNVEKSKSRKVKTSKCRDERF